MMLGLGVGLAGSANSPRTTEVSIEVVAPSSGGWVLTTGFWDDDLFWIDEETWSN